MRRRQTNYHVCVARFFCSTPAPKGLVSEGFESSPDLRILDGLDQPRFVLPQTLVAPVLLDGELVGERIRAGDFPANVPNCRTPSPSSWSCVRQRGVPFVASESYINSLLMSICKRNVCSLRKYDQLIVQSCTKLYEVL